MKESMKKYVKAILNLLIAAVILILIVWLVPKVLVFFMPFVIGWIIAWIATPAAKFVEEKLKIKRKMGSAVVIILVIGAVVLVAYLVGAKLLHELVGFLQDLPTMWTALENDINEIAAKFSTLYVKLPIEVQETLNGLGAQASEFGADLVSKISSPTLEAVSNFAKKLPTVVIGIIMCLLSAYFFVAEREALSETVRNLLPDTLEYKLGLMKNSVIGAVGGYFKAQFKIEVWIYLLLVIGFFILDVKYALLIGVGVALLDFLPFFGTGTVMLPWAIIKFLSADYKMTIGILLIWGISQLVRQIIQPKIVGDSIGVPPIPTLFLLYIGYRFGGVVGMIVAVPIGIIVWTMYKEGMFDTTKNSIKILSAGLNHFRKLTPQDMYIIDTYKQDCEEALSVQKKIDEKKNKPEANHNLEETRKNK